jgi:1,4-alpha-glucan branching enzyme
MAFVVQATSYGLMMIWMGEELGEYKEKTPGVAKLDWSLIQDREDNANAINKQQLQYYKDVIQLRKSNLALTTPNFEFIFEHIDDQILVWHRWNTINENANHVIVICNWSSTTHETYTILNIPQNGRWYEWLNGDKEYLVENNKLIVDNVIDHTARIFVHEMKKCDDEKRSLA